VNVVGINLSAHRSEEGGCGGSECLKATILHELAHSCGGDECFAEACAAKFFPECARRYLKCASEEECIKICQ
jgi:hypothetical protein